jgi:hypothetical protein
MKFVQGIMTKENNRLYYIKATTHNGRKAWYFLFAKPTASKAVLELGENSNCDLRDFGEMIYSGFGETAPHSLIKQVNEQYKTEFVA